jgi:hypothetical protein
VGGVVGDEDGGALQ